MEEIAQVYARSLHQAASDAGKFDDVRDQLGEVADAISQSRELQTFFFSPYFSSDEKREALGKAITGADPLLVNFLELLVENHRMPVIFRMRRALDTIWREENKLLPVQITSAIELDSSISKNIGDAIGTQTGQTVELTTVVDPDVLGGLVLRVGNSILDASIRNRLEQLRKSVATAA
ncbi:MAG TPA: ATP synthase F1 subunit delta [Baekduia sp.]|nr:ATP synthase F1 subunit delta [Baekduia sp.]